nr:hypothetical protein [Mesorhizobium ciceri]
MAFHVEEAELEHGEQADRPCPDNQYVRPGDIGHECAFNPHDRENRNRFSLEIMRQITVL